MAARQLIARDDLDAGRVDLSEEGAASVCRRCIRGMCCATTSSTRWA